ncbi:MAG: hypothetical protein ACEQSK_20325, partial [Sphingomonadaceae bacterium]
MGKSNQFSNSDILKFDHGAGYACDTTSAYKFTVSNGVVTAEQRVIGSHTVTVTIPTTASFTVGTGTITETITTTKGTETLQFAVDATDATLYHLIAEKTVITNPTTVNGSNTFGYAFTVANGAVTAVSVTDTHGSKTSSHALTIGATTSYSVATDGTITETTIAGHAIETTTYAKSGTAGLYAITSEAHSFIQSGSATTLLDVEPRDRAKFSIDSSGAVTAISKVLSDGSTAVITPGSGTTYSQLAAGYVL